MLPVHASRPPPQRTHKPAYATKLTRGCARHRCEHGAKERWAVHATWRRHDCHCACGWVQDAAFPAAACLAALPCPAAHGMHPLPSAVYAEGRGCITLCVHCGGRSWSALQMFTAQLNGGRSTLQRPRRGAHAMHCNVMFAPQVSPARMGALPACPCSHACSCLAPYARPSPAQALHTSACAYACLLLEPCRLHLLLLYAASQLVWLVVLLR